MIWKCMFMLALTKVLHSDGTIACAQCILVPNFYTNCMHADIYIYIYWNEIWKHFGFIDTGFVSVLISWITINRWKYAIVLHHSQSLFCWHNHISSNFLRMHVNWYFHLHHIYLPRYEPFSRFFLFSKNKCIVSKQS